MTKRIMTGLKRILRMQESARNQMLCGILIHDPKNIFYFTNVYPHEPSFLIVPSESEPELVAPGSVYAEAVKDSLVPVVRGDLDIASTAWDRLLAKKILKPPPKTIFIEIIRKIAQCPLGIEESHLSVNLLNRFKVSNYIDISPVIMEYRSKKDSFEIENITQACQIADRSMEELKKSIRLGLSERELSGIFDARAKFLGADETKCRVRSGKNTALPFSRWMDGELERGPLLIDYGVRVNGYWSDITRMFYLGAEPDSKFLELYDLVLKARSQSLAVMKQGESIYIPEIRIRELFRQSGFEENIVYAAGHGIGLDVHEEPILSMPPKEEMQSELLTQGFGKKPFIKARVPEKQYAGLTLDSSRDLPIFMPSYEDEENVFQRNQVFALEPGIYLESMGVRVEDVILIAEKPTMLSSFSTELVDIVIPV